MSILGRKLPVGVVAAMALLMVLAALLPALSGTPSREIRLVVRDMAFYLEGDPRTPNPTLDVRAGERLRIVVRNTDRGMKHDFTLPATGAALDTLSWNESAGVVIDVPQTPGSYDYECRPHRLMMRGTIRVH